MITTDKLAQAFAIGSAPAKDEYRFGTVHDVNTDGSVYVKLAQDATTRCACLYDATVGDRVQVCIKANGQAVVLGSIGKEEDAGPKPLVPYVLYSNASGTSGTVPLNESAANFKFIDVFVYDNNGASQGVNHIRVFDPDGKLFNVTHYEPSGTSNMLMRYARYKCNGTSLSLDTSVNYGYKQFGNTSLSTSVGTNYINVVRVIGYK